MAEFILASGSPRRQDLLTAIGVRFRVIKPEVDESTRPGETPEDYVRRLSQEKAAAVLPGLAGPAYVLAADTTVIHNGEILGKPPHEAEARRMLLRLRDQTHRVCTGFTLLYAPADEPQRGITQVVCTEVKMRFYAASEMERWISSGGALDKAGGYAIQSTLFEPVESIEGSYNNVVGLPTEAVEAALQEFGIHPDENNNGGANP